MTSVGKEVEKLEPSHITVRNVKWYRCFGQQSAVPQNVKHRETLWASNSTPRYLPKRNVNIHTSVQTQMFIVTLFIIAKKKKKGNHHLRTDK